jgi:hypothetical protein
LASWQIAATGFILPWVGEAGGRLKQESGAGVELLLNGGIKNDEPVAWFTPRECAGSVLVL